MALVRKVPRVEVNMPWLFCLLKEKVCDKAAALWYSVVDGNGCRGD